MEQQVYLNEGNAKKVAYPKVKFSNLNLSLRKGIFYLLSFLESKKGTLKGRRSVGKTDSHYMISRSLCRLDQKFFKDFLEIGIDIFISDLGENFEKLHEDLKCIALGLGTISDKEDICKALHQKIIANPNLLEKAKIFRLFIRDLINLFETEFEEAKINRYKSEFAQWEKENLEYGSEKLRAFNDKFQKTVDSERKNLLSEIKRKIYGHYKTNCFLKNSYEIALVLTDIFNCDYNES